MDIKNFYLEMPMTELKYLQVPLSMFLIEIQKQYHLQKIVHKNNVMAEVRHGMYGLS